MDTRIHIRHLILKELIGRLWFIPEFLNHLTELEHLTTEITNQTWWVQCKSGETPPVYCERLAFLSLALGANIARMHLIKLLKVPCLVRLEIYNAEEGQCEIASTIDSLIGLVRRSSSTLKMLVVRDVFMARFHLALLLELAPGIQSVVVHDTEDTPFPVITGSVIEVSVGKALEGCPRALLNLCLDKQLTIRPRFSPYAKQFGTSLAKYHTAIYLLDLCDVIYTFLIRLSIIVAANKAIRRVGRSGLEEIFTQADNLFYEAWNMLRDQVHARL
ncbi:uncharacterized protein BT62DRAFT_920333 [Guyanagaster necrorhizus]|uniref:Uncharacterized protein n=1 Tax=Guyanagaster necrorhizus TaxID=856835 RepID=A0A9P7VT67_9AGAR|nr:uncharacterized protein BT62DRAFT_920333 [Guyanagaster necrorhizus MCA 3950]KAG7445634.1 hypothetical protein BT62DRAFT_920333 [Guyanagaster necrorhizus MCA 3950]